MECSKYESQRYVKTGVNHNRQRYKYKNCGYQFTQTTDKNATKRAFAPYPYVAGLSINAIGRIPNAEPSTILYRVKKFTLKTCEKTVPQGEVLVELEEMWYFLCSRKTRFGSGRRIVELPEIGELRMR
ncbi:MAG: hypothetical protein LBC12_03925 [Nitrososphaerota archaeon]|jgi:transposase-like protein|nr:hypothetical protein [Nitrososphaerota archaeon]